MIKFLSIYLFFGGEDGGMKKKKYKMYQVDLTLKKSAKGISFVISLGQLVFNTNWI